MAIVFIKCLQLLIWYQIYVFKALKLNVFTRRMFFLQNYFTANHYLKHLTATLILRQKFHNLTSSIDFNDLLFSRFSLRKILLFPDERHR